MTTWPAETLEQWPIDRLLPYARNAKRHPPEQVAKIAASIREFGWTVPALVAEDGTLIAGHGRILAARQLGIAVIPTMVAKGWSESKIKSYRLVDNKIAESDWDFSLLEAELKALAAAGADVALTGFSEAELKVMLGESSAVRLTDPDAVPDLPETPMTRRGDLWLLGRHRLLCGDSTAEADVAALMGEDDADLCFTSPPYGQQRDYAHEAKSKIADWDALMRGVFNELPMAPTGQVLVNLGLIHRENEWQPYWEDWIAWMRQQGWKRFGWYVWDQGIGLMGDWNGRLGPSHEFIFQFTHEFVFHFNHETVRPIKWVSTKLVSRHKKGFGKPGMRNKDGSVGKISSPSKYGGAVKIPDSVIRINRNMVNDIARHHHPATFPVALPEYFIKSWPGIVYEPFSGSGTTLIAAEKTDSACRAMEIVPRYCDLAVVRWQQFTGQKAIHAVTGLPFGEPEC